MSKQKVIHPDRDASFVTGAYSDGVVVDGFLFVSGQACVDFKTSQFILGTIEEETTVGGKPAIRPGIEGWARIYGYNTITIDPEDDPYAYGFQVI